MNYKEITADEYEKLLQNKKDIFNNTFKNTNKLVEDKKQILKTDPDAIIKNQQKDAYIEKLSNLISKKINNTDELKKIANRINLKEISDKIDLKNDENSQPSYKDDYMYYIKNSNILADKIVEIYRANPNSKVYNPINKENKVKLHSVINKIDKDDQISKQYNEFVREFRNINNNTKILYDYQTYKNLVLDKIIDDEISTDDSFIKEVGKNLLKI